jgi:hypothetical protein
VFAGGAPGMAEENMARIDRADAVSDAQATDSG